MTVSTTTARSAQNGDGASVTFTVPFYFLANTDLLVYIGGVLQVLTTNYSVTGAGVAAGGSITFTAAPAIGTGNVVIIRDPDQLQSVKYPANDPFPASTHERALDKLTMLLQRVRDLLGRSFTLPDSDTSGASLSVPTPQASYLLGWNSTANGLANYSGASGTLISGAMTPVVQAATLAAGRTAFGLATGATTVVGTAATQNVGTAANNVVQLDGTPKLPAVDGSALTNVTGRLINSINFTAKVVALTSISNATPAVLTCVAATDLPEVGSPIQLTTSGGLPTGLSLATTYYVSNASGSTFNLCLTYVDALAGTNKINTSSAGSGTHTLNSVYVKNASSSYVVVEAWGGGGGAAGSDSGPSVGAGGGGAGAYTRRKLATSLIGATETVTIGAGGAAGAATPTAGGNGGSTTFGAWLTAPGGTGSVLPATNSGPGGAGGARGTGGDWTLAGNSGFPGTGNAEVGGMGGSTTLGGVQANAGGQPVAGVNAFNNSGSGGTAGQTNTTSVAGGAGGSGRVIVHEYT